MLPAVDQHPLRPRVGARQDRRPHPRDLAADRPFAAGGHRLQGARREHHRARLRRAPGRRRHPHGRDHRRLRRARRRRRPPARRRALWPASRSPARWPRSASASSTARPGSTCHYDDDVRAETDMNVVMTGDGRFVEVQGTAEGAPFDRAELDTLLALAEKGCAELTRLQRRGAGRWLTRRGSSSPRATPRSSRRCGGSSARPCPRRRRRRGARPRRRRGVRRAGRGPADLRRQRPAQGARRPRRDRPALARRRQRPVRRRPERHARRAVGALVGTARSADDRNNALLLHQLADVPDERRGAHFACAVAFCAPERRGARRRGPDGRPGDPRDAGERRLRLRRALRGRRVPRPDHRRARPRRQGRRSPTAAAPCARSPPRSPPSWRLDRPETGRPARPQADDPHDRRARVRSERFELSLDGT